MHGTLVVLLRLLPRHLWVAVFLTLSILMATDVPAVAGRMYTHADRTPTIDGVQCAPKEYFVTHEHQYVALYENGRHLNLPAEVGIMRNCLYWLHVHDSHTPGGVNILHNELPNHRVFILGAFLDIWRYWGGQMRGDISFLGALAHARTLHIFYNGKAWKAPYRSIPLRRHAVIYLEIGNQVVPPKPHDFSALRGFESSH